MGEYMPKLSLKELKAIIAEEIELVKEGKNKEEDHALIAKVAQSASKLLAAITKFEPAATGPMVNALTPHLDAIKTALRQMVETPASYVQREKSQKVTFKSSKTSDED